jgi:hypothetical protein
MFSAEELAVTIEAFTYPDEFGQFDGLATPSPGVSVGQQSRPIFGLSYRTKVGNDLQGDNFGYKLHLLYGCMASPSEKAYATVNDSPAAIAFSWSVSTNAVAVADMKPTSLITIDSTVVDAVSLAAFEDILYGGTADPMLPLPDDVIASFDTAAADVPATGANAGTPGTWTPAGSTPPASVTALQAAGIVASPSTAWATGEYVQTGTSGVPGQANWDGSAWVLGVSP